MSYSYHPFPIVAVIKFAVITAFLCGLIVLARPYLGEFFLPLLALIAIIGAMRILSSFAIAYSYTVTLDDSSIIYTYGVLSRKQYVLPYSKVSESSYTQGLVQRIFGLGNINVDTPGGSDMAMRVQDVRYSDIELTLAKIKAASK